jgi:signal transduction histidine kinase
MNEATGGRKRRIFRPLSFFVIWGVLALVLIFNGVFEAKRAKDNLYRLLADEGAAIAEGLSRSAQSSLTLLTALETMPEAALLAGYSPANLLALEESVIDEVLETAFEIDRKLGRGTPGAEKLAELSREEKVAGIEVLAGQIRSAYHRNSEAATRESRPPFYQGLLQGKASYAIRRSERRATGQMDLLSIAVLRKAGEGILVLHADSADLYHLRRRVVLQGVIDEWAGKGDILYLRFQGRDGEVWAGFDSREGRKNGEKSGPAERGGQADRAGGNRSVTGRGVLETTQALSPDAKNQGILVVGLNTEKVDQIIAGDVRNLIYFSLFLLAFAGIGIVLIYRLETRHLQRLREMEERVHRSEKLSSLANLAAGVAHEIRNPLNAIGMAIQRLQREFPQENPELQKEYFQFTDVLRGEVKRVNEIIEQFLFFARPARMNLQPLRLQELFNDLAVLLKEPAERGGIVLEEEVDPALPPIRGDRQRLKEALWNLVQNAFQAMTAGGKLHLSARVQNPKEIRIEIADTGEGVPEENLGRIFDYYFTTKEKGLGLGLPSAHKIIQEHGGTIAVRSQRGKGTTFEIVLPVPKEEE